MAWPQRGRINLQGQQAYRAQEMPLCDLYLVQRQVVEPGGRGSVLTAPGLGEGRPNPAALTSDGIKIFKPKSSVHLNLSKEAGLCELVNSPKSST